MLFENRDRQPILSRRSLMTGTAASLLAASSASAQDTPAKGPAVWLDLDQKQLDDAYDQGKYAPNLRQIVERYRINSEAVRARLGAPKRLSYGSTPIEGADLFATA